MGIRPVPPDIPYSAHDCDACFGIGKTPKEMKAWFSGMEFDPEGVWPPEPLPRFFILEQIYETPCRWYGGDIDAWNVAYTAHTVGGFSRLHLDYQDSTGFISLGGDCQKSFQNNGEWPVTMFEGGAGIVVPSAGDEGLYLASIAEAAGFPADMDTKMDLIAIDEDYFAAHFYRKQYCKDLLVKFAIADF